MELESWFEFINEDAVRIKGTRIYIETVVKDYLDGASPEEILLRYPTLSPDKIHAVILYYLTHSEQVEKYLERVREFQEQGWKEQQLNPSDFVRELSERIRQQRLALHKNLQPVGTT